MNAKKLRRHSDADGGERKMISLEQMEEIRRQAISAAEAAVKAAVEAVEKQIAQNMENRDEASESVSDVAVSTPLSSEADKGSSTETGGDKTAFVNEYDRAVIAAEKQIAADIGKVNALLKETYMRANALHEEAAAKMTVAAQAPSSPETASVEDSTEQAVKGMCDYLSTAPYAEYEENMKAGLEAVRRAVDEARDYSAGDEAAQPKPDTSGNGDANGK